MATTLSTNGSASADAHAALARSWSQAYGKGVLAHAKADQVSNEEVFADVYHSLVHSSPDTSNTMLRLEHSHAETVASKCADRDAQLADMEERHNRDMAAAVEKSARADEDDENADEEEMVDGNAERTASDAEKAVNELAARHLEERQLAELRWESQLGHLRDTQRRELREWVMCVHQEIKTNREEKKAAKANANVNSTTSTSKLTSDGGIVDNSGSSRPKTVVSKSDSLFSMDVPSTASASHALQESFTVTLGAQMKQMHNLRLVAADPLDLCAYPEEQEDALPKRMQTAMTLYSNNLCGLVVLTDERLSTFSGMTKEIGSLCQRSTEYHFPSFDQQLQTVKEEYVAKALSWRKDYKKRQELLERAIENNGGGAAAAPAASDISAKYSRDSAKSLSNGDFYVSRHSNLCEVHVLFHLVCDESVSSGGINSRHPVVMGLRNVLKAASLSDVTTVTLPLLLTHDLSEEMTVAWCMKRAELVFKCVKGFMMEVSSWGGSELKTLQFLVPKGIDNEVFTRLTTMLSSIFRTSNPIRGK